MDSSSEINKCHEIIPYVSPIDILQVMTQVNQRNNISRLVSMPSGVSNHTMENASSTILSSAYASFNQQEDNPLLLLSQNEPEITPHQLAGKKEKLINSEIIAGVDVKFVILPLEDKINTYTVKLYKGQNLNDPFSLNHKYHDLLHKWKFEPKRRPSGRCDMIGGSEIPSKKRKEESSSSEIEPASKIQKSYTEQSTHRDKSTLNKQDETGNFVVDAFTNLMRSDNYECRINVKQSVQKDEKIESIKNMDFQDVEVAPHKKLDKTKESANKVISLLKKSNELDTKFSESVDMGLHKIISHDKEKEDAKNEELTIEFSYNEVENEKEGVQCTTNFGPQKISSEKKIDNTKEGNKTILEDPHQQGDNLSSYDNVFSKQKEVKVEVDVRVSNMDDFDPFAHRVENNVDSFDPFQFNEEENIYDAVYTISVNKTGQ